jgi:tetratricopeptide (TPR) repeat protein
MKCGQQLPDEANFCFKCGSATMKDVSVPSLEATPQQRIDVSTQTFALHTPTSEVLSNQELYVEPITEGQLAPYPQEHPASKTDAGEVPLDEQVRELLAEAMDKFLGGREGKPDVREALRLCNKAIELDKNNSEAHDKKGFFLSNTQRYEDALESFEQAIRLGNPPTAVRDIKAEALAGKGLALSMLSRYEEALSAINESIKLNKNSSSAHQIKSAILFRLGHIEESKEEEMVSEVLFKHQYGETT